MPFRSDAQRRFFNSPGAAKAGITSQMTNEWNAASKGLDLPERTEPPKRRQKFSLPMKKKLSTKPPMPSMPMSKK